MNLEQLQWLVIIISITLIVTVFGVGILQSGVKAAVESNAPLILKEISGIISSMQAAPDGTTHIYDLPKMNCKISVNENYVRIETDDGIYKESIVSNEFVQPTEIECDHLKKKTIKFVKNGAVSVEV